MEEYIEKLTDELTEFICHADNAMGADEMAKTIAQAIKRAARRNDMRERNYFYNCVSYYAQP